MLLPALQKFLPANSERADGRSLAFAHHCGSHLALSIPALLLLSLAMSKSPQHCEGPAGSCPSSCWCDAGKTLSFPESPGKALLWVSQGAQSTAKWLSVFIDIFLQHLLPWTQKLSPRERGRQTVCVVGALVRPSVYFPSTTHSRPCFWTRLEGVDPRVSLFVCHPSASARAQTHLNSQMNVA